MAGYQRQNIGGQRAGVHGLHALAAEQRIHFHHGIPRQVGNGTVVGNVHVADQVAQAEQGFHQQVAFLAIGLDLDRLFTGAQAAAAGQALLQLIFAPRNGGQAKLPFAHGFGAFQISLARHKLCQMAVARGGNAAIAQEQIKFNAVGAGKGTVHPIRVAVLITGFIVLFDKFAVNGEEVHAFVSSLIEPSKVVNALDVDLDILAGNIFQAQFLIQNVGQQRLGAEHLVAAAERLDLGEHMVQGTHAEGHRVGVVDDPGIGTVITDRFSDGDIHGDGAHGAHETACTYGIAHRLIDAVSFRRVDVAFHLVKGAGQDGDDDKIRAGQGLLQRIRHSILPV